ncbi:hypothetical protein C0J52_07102 [Blattella germanica]|nr:hypothetical protein C0J52_07102 [Blattella germanica]
MSFQHKSNYDSKTKQILPKDWIVRRSKRYPDKTYYFNTVTKCSTWDFPVMTSTSNDDHKKVKKTEELSKLSLRTQKTSKIEKQEKTNHPSGVKKEMAKRGGASKSRKDTNLLPSKRQHISDDEELSHKRTKRDVLKIPDSGETCRTGRDGNVCNSASKTLPETANKPFQLALLSTRKGSNNIPLLSLKESKEAAAQENKLRQVLKAKRNLPAAPHKKTESSSVGVKLQGDVHKVVFKITKKKEKSTDSCEASTSHSDDRSDKTPKILPHKSITGSSSKRAAQNRIEQLQKKLSLSLSNTPKSSLPLERKSHEKRSAGDVCAHWRNFMFQIHEVRNQIQTDGLNYDGEPRSETMFGNSALSSAEMEEWFIVVDTNIFISNLVCQTLSDTVNKENVSDLPDDSILQCCLQIAGRKKKVVLLSNDKNLCNKALINGIKAYQNSEIFEALQKMNQDHCQRHESTDHKPVIGSGNQGPSISKSGTGQQLESKSEDSSAKATEILSELKMILKNFLEKVLENEMRKVFDDLWIQIVIYKPPWELEQILSAFLKHWIAVFSVVLPSNCKSSIQNLKNFFTKFQLKADGTSLAALKEIIEESLLLYKLLPFKEFEVLRSESISKLEVKYSKYIHIHHSLMYQCDGNKQELPKASEPVLHMEAIRDVLEEFYNFILIFWFALGTALEKFKETEAIMERGIAFLQGNYF